MQEVWGEGQQRERRNDNKNEEFQKERKKETGDSLFVTTKKLDCLIKNLTVRFFLFLSH